MRNSSVATRHAATGRIAGFMCSLGRCEQCLLSTEVTEAPRRQEVGARVREAGGLQRVDDVPSEVLKAQDSAFRVQRIPVVLGLEQVRYLTRVAHPRPRERRLVVSDEWRGKEERA